MMGYGRRSSRIISGLLRYDPKIVVHSNPIQEFVSRRPNLGEATILRNGVRKGGPLFDGAKRFYSWGSNNNNNNQVLQLKASRGWGWKRWMWNLETCVALALFGGVVGLDIYTGSWETVPYTKRRQLLLPPRASLVEDAGLGAEKVEKMNEDLTKILLSPSHPDNVRLRTIIKNLILAFRRKEGDARIKKRWELLLINVPSHHVISSSGGKIFIFRGILDYCEEDAEIAAFIAPEIGRVVARHYEEKYAMLELLTFLFLLILHVFVSSMPSMFKYFRFPFSRSLFYFITMWAVTRLLKKIYSLKMDVEADYIGLMLLASAGYDPRVAYRAREKMVRIKGGSSWEKMRARRLILDMEEALSIYREVVPEQDV